MLLQDLEQDAHFIETAAKSDERFDLLMLIEIFMGCKHRQQRLLHSPETVGGTISQERQLGLQVFGLSMLSEFFQLSELSIIFSGQLSQMLKMVGGIVQRFISLSVQDSSGQIDDLTGHYINWIN